MENAFSLISEVGFPIAAALAGGYFVFLTLKFILAGVLSSIKNLTAIIVTLDNRVKVMVHDVIRIDIRLSSILGIEPDIGRISRADGKEDARKD
jgi:hypothetical protein